MSKVLIVDDSPVELTNLRTILSDAGWETVTASDGLEAVSKAASEKPSLILLDVLMPGMDGFEACRNLRSNDETRNIPVVFVSSKHEKADHMWAKMQGAKCLIGKPYEPNEILDTLKAYA